MLQMLMNFVLAFFFGWLVVLSFVVYRLRKHYLQLVARTKKRSIDEILDSLMNESEGFASEQEKIKKQLVSFDTRLKKSYQKLGIIRFNPFGRIDGDKSFVIALLNTHNDGLVINFIYTHEGIRVYTKPIKNGEGSDLALSQEEKEAINKAN